MTSLIIVIMQNCAIETIGLRGEMWLRAQHSTSGTNERNLVETDLHVLNG